MHYIRYNPRTFGLEGFLEVSLRTIDKLIHAIDAIDPSLPGSRDLADSLCDNIYDLEYDLEYVFGKNWYR